jgi:Ran GTPase-activating protein (RanGAP) involved in mRNA processing and transport
MAPCKTIPVCCWRSPAFLWVAISYNESTLKILCDSGQPRLKIVDLEANLLGAEGMGALASSLLKLPCLQSLDLGANGIGSEGINAIASSIHHASHLQVLCQH